MAAKIIILLALLILPSILNAQSYKEAFSVELKLDKTNFDFGEDVNPILTVKNISGKKDSLAVGHYEVFSFLCNTTIYHSNRISYCLCAITSTDYIAYKVFQPNETYTEILPLRGVCSSTFEVEDRLSESLLDTGFYTVETYLSRVVNRGSKNEYYKRIKPDKISFYVNPPDEDTKFAYEELRSIVNYTLEEFRDTVFMLSVLNKLDGFVRKDINSYFVDLAYGKAQLGTLHVHSYKSNFLKLSEYYLSVNPNGSMVSLALYEIYRDTYNKTKNYDEGILKMEKYIEENRYYTK